MDLNLETMERFVVSSGCNVPSSALISPRTEGLRSLLWQRGSGTETGREAVLEHTAWGTTAFHTPVCWGFFFPS